MRQKLLVVMPKPENNWRECSNCDIIQLINVKGRFDVTYCYRKAERL